MTSQLHYCTNPDCQLCRTEDAIDCLIWDLGVKEHFHRTAVRDDIASGNVWPEDEA